MKNESFARELLHDYKWSNIRMFILFILVIILLAISVVFNIYQALDTSTITDTLEIQDVETIDNSHIKIGDDLWEKSQ